MSEQLIILKNSSVKDKIPQTKDLQFGEIAINTNTGKLFTRRTNKIVDEIISIGSDINTSQKVEKLISGEYLNLNIQDRQIKEINISSHTSINFNNTSDTNTFTRIVLFLNNTGDFAISWINDIFWENGEAPSISNNSWTIIEISCIGQKYFGTVKATNMKEAK